MTQFAFLEREWLDVLDVADALTRVP